MRYAITIPNFGDWAAPLTVLSADIGATWWIESIGPWRFTWDGTAEGWPSVELARDRIRMGLPRV